MLASPRSTYHASLPDSCAGAASGIPAAIKPIHIHTSLCRKLHLRIARVLRLGDQLDSHVPDERKAPPGVDHASPARRATDDPGDAPRTPARWLSPHAQQTDPARGAVAQEDG